MDYSVTQAFYVSRSGQTKNNSCKQVNFPFSLSTLSALGYRQIANSDQHSEHSYCLAHAFKQGDFYRGEAYRKFSKFMRFSKATG